MPIGQAVAFQATQGGFDSPGPLHHQAHSQASMSSCMLLIRGLPGSGKSTLGRALAELGWLHLETDQFFVQDGHYLFDESRLAQVHGLCLAQSMEALAQGRCVVVTNVFHLHEHMWPYMEAARDAGVGFRVVEASGSWPSVHAVPSLKVRAMRAAWESLDPYYRGDDSEFILPADIRASAHIQGATPDRLPQRRQRA